MEVYVLHTRSEWEQAIGERPHSFQQSFAWGEMQQAMGHPVYRIAFDGGVATIIVLGLRFGQQVLFAPYGPVCDAGIVIDEELISEITQSAVLKRMSREHHGAVLRIEPQHPVVLSGRLRRAPEVSPASTRILDLTKNATDLLASLKQKTRYNIKLAQRNGVKVSFLSQAQSPDWEALTGEWWQLVVETSARHGIGHHEQSYYQQMLQQLGTAGLLEVGQATHEGDLLAMTINVGYQHTYTYVHGAATHHKKKLMASYALQWAAITRAQETGYTHYDMYGVAPEGAVHHPLSGVTRFKTGFGGEVIAYPGTFEYGLNAFYPLYRLYRACKK